VPPGPESLDTTWSQAARRLRQVRALLGTGQRSGVGASVEVCAHRKSTPAEGTAVEVLRLRSSSFWGCTLWTVSQGR